MSSNPLLSSFQSPKVKNKFKCEICLKLFSTNGNLKNHINTIHNHIFPFKCPIQNCNKAYSNQSRLEVHYRTHIGIKPFICPICKKSFNEKGNLKTHISFHTNLRPFKCNYCNKSYKTQGHLKDHIEIQHLKLRKYICKFCFNKFGRRSTLSAHLKIHFDDKSFFKTFNKKNDCHFKKNFKNKKFNFICSNGNNNLTNNNVLHLNVISKSNSSTSLNSINKKDNLNNNNENEIENNNFELNDNLINEKKSNDVNIDYSEFTKNFNFSNFECENNFNLNLIDSNSSYCDNSNPNIEMEKDNFPFFINDINNGYDKK